MSWVREVFPSVSYPALRLAFGVLVVALAGCPPQVPAQTFLKWTLGRQPLGQPAPPWVFVVWVPKGGSLPKPPPTTPARPNTGSGTQKLAASEATGKTSEVLSECLPATSILPMPKDDGRILLTVNGIVHVLDPKTKRWAEIVGMNRDIPVVDLLALRKVQDGIEVVTVVQKSNVNEPLIYSLLVQSDHIVMLGTADLPFGENRAAMLSHYDVPRCSREEDERCLRVSQNDESTQVEEWSPNGHRDPKILDFLAGAVDASWSPVGDGSMYVLARCDRGEAPSR